MLSADNILGHLRRGRFGNKDLLEITRILEHVEKYGCDNKTQRIIDEIIRLLTDGTTTEESTVVKCGCVVWVCHLQELQKLPGMNESQFDLVIQWLMDKLENVKANMDVISRICVAFCGLFSTHPMSASKYFISISSGLQKYVCWDSTIDVVVNAIRCLDNIIGSLSCSPLTKEQIDTCAGIGGQILHLFYSESKPTVDPEIVPVYLLHSLQLIHRITSINAEFAKQNVSELLGVSRAYFHFGIENDTSNISSPQKVYMSQQALFDSAEDFEININSEKTRSCGGKTPKTRKPRLKANTVDRNVVNASPERKVALLSMDMKTSDSDASETENPGNRVLFERNRMAKIRLASISLVGSIVKSIERRLMYGYWHALFPCGTGESPDNLLYIGQHDPNMRCRCAALQVCAQLLYGSKGFLHQAEINAKRCPAAFIPFSVSLGFTLLAIYQALTTILSTESSLPVLTQTLKCLAVLVQATSFQKLEKGFVHGFVRHVRPLIYHRDAAIQVSSLMVLEFLVTSTEATADIAAAVGLPQAISTRNMTKANPLGEEELDIIDDEEFIESDISEEENTDPAENGQITGAEKCLRSDRSWLLLRVLHNLADHDKVVMATSIRIESIQVLIALSSHFAMLKPHLTEVSKVLKLAIGNSLPDVRLYAARCIDTCAFQISRQMLENASSSSAETRSFSKFWTDMIPIIMDHIRRDCEEMSTVRIALCDALSNIGVVMFENCPHSSQIALLSFLSGVSSDCSDDTIVRAAAARALGVYVLYPSLRDDMVFVENTADLTLRLVTDSNLLVRVKAFWTLGNISDALISKVGDVKDNHERISDELLFRMINVATAACSDNDKVRCNAVRTLGNLLRLLTGDHFNCESSHMNWRQLFEKAICKLTDCIRSSGNAKVKWNTCYAISSIIRNRTIFDTTDLNWQNTLYSALCHVIIHHSNFKVRINATSAITNIAERSHFGNYFEKFWSSAIEAIEQSHNLDNFHEYNHRDNLQEQLCLALAHIVKCSEKEDWPMLKRHLSLHVETIRNTWKRVVLRMVPEKAAPLLSCPVVLVERGKCHQDLTVDQKNANDFLSETFAIE